MLTLTRCPRTDLALVMYMLFVEGRVLPTPETPTLHSFRHIKHIRHIRHLGHLIFKLEIDDLISENER